MKLYYFPNTRGLRPRWLLEEAGAPYELVLLNLPQREHKTPEYLQIHPLGAVPSLVDGDTTLFDSTAICLYLAEHLANGIFAPSTNARAEYYQWILFAMTTLEPKIAPLYMKTFRTPQDQHSQIATGEDLALLSPLLRPLSQHLKTSEFITDTFSAADVIVGGVLHWADIPGALRDDEPLQDYVARLRDRPAFLKANSKD